MSYVPVFLVGPPRSGTTLLAAMLSSHSAYACGPETQFFTTLTDIDIDEAIQDSAWPKLAVEKIVGIKLGENNVSQLYDVTVEEMTNFLVDKTPSASAMLAALTETCSKKQQKPCWIEKTPDHMLHAQRIRKYFPDSPIIRIIRDPRDSSLSTTKLPWWSDSYLVNCQIWEDKWRESHAFFLNDRLSRTVRYEDLVTQPESTLRKLIELFCVDFEAEMLMHERHAEGVITADEPWKKSVSKPLHSDRLSVWKKELSDELAKTAGVICYDSINTFNYDGATDIRKEYYLHPFSYKWLENHADMVIDAASYNIRLKKYNSVASDDYILCEIPALGSTNLKRVIKIISFLGWLVTRKLKNNPLTYVQSIRCDGRAEKLCFYGLRLLGKQFKL